MRVASIKSTVAAAAIAMVGFMPTKANAEAVVGTHNLADVLVAKGILSKDEAKAALESNDNKLKIDATIFADYTMENDKNTGTGWAANQTGTQIKKQGVNLTRTYLTGRYYINDTWMMRLTSDFSAETNVNGISKQNQVYVKYAFAQGSFTPALRVRFGVIQDPWIPYVQDHLWAHRYVSKIMPDRLGLWSSADAGVGLAGQFLGGMVRYQMAVLNGRGYGNTQPTQGQDFNSRLELRPFKGLIAELGYRNGYAGNKQFTTGTTTYNNNIVGGKQKAMHAMVTYGSAHDYRVGVNYLVDKNKASTSPVKTTGYGAWAWANVAETSVGTIGLLGRYEHIKTQPYNNLGNLVGNISDQKRTRYLLGIELKPAHGPVFTLAYDTEKYSNLLGTGTAAPGTAGATTNAGQDKKINKFQLFAKYHF